MKRKCAFGAATTLIVSCICFNAFSGTQRVDGSLSKINDVQDEQRTALFITAIESIDPNMGGLTTDINNIYTKTCGRSLRTSELRDIMANSLEYSSLLKKVTLNTSYRQSTEYQMQLNASFGACASDFNQ